MKNKVNEVNSKKMYDLFTKAEIYNETIRSFLGTFVYL